MPVPDFESFKVANGELSSSSKFNNLVQAIEDELGDIDADQLPADAAIARGRMGNVEVSSAQAGITTLTDLTSVTITWTAVAGRRYRLAVQVTVTAVTNPASAAIFITDSGNTQAGSPGITPSLVAGDLATVTAFAVVTPGAGSKTYKVRIQRNGGTGTITAQPSSLVTSFVVEDIGI